MGHQTKINPVANENRFFDVEQSYDRVKDHPDFFDFFYHGLFSSERNIFEMFKKTNLESQKKALRDSIQYMIMLNAGSKIADRKFDELAITHNRDHRNIKPSLYKCWIDSLIKALAAYDPQFGTTLEGKWREALAAGIHRMSSKY